MDSHYDPEADTAYFKLCTTQIVESEEVAPDIILDFDAANRVVGIEALNASRTLAPGAWQPLLPGSQAKLQSSHQWLQRRRTRKKKLVRSGSTNAARSTSRKAFRAALEMKLSLSG